MMAFDRVTSSLSLYPTTISLHSSKHWSNLRSAMDMSEYSVCLVTEPLLYCIIDHVYQKSIMIITIVTNDNNVFQLFMMLMVMVMVMLVEEGRRLVDSHNST